MIDEFIVRSANITNGKWPNVVRWLIDFEGYEPSRVEATAQITLGEFTLGGHLALALNAVQLV